MLCECVPFNISQLNQSCPPSLKLFLMLTSSAHDDSLGMFVVVCKLTVIQRLAFGLQTFSHKVKFMLNRTVDLSSFDLLINLSFC
jgi:hypothetical protein